MISSHHWGIVFKFPLIVFSQFDWLNLQCWLNRMSWSEWREWDEFVWESTSLANVSFSFKPIILKTFIGHALVIMDNCSHDINKLISLKIKVLYSSLSALILNTGISILLIIYSSPFSPSPLPIGTQLCWGIKVLSAFLDIEPLFSPEGQGGIFLSQYRQSQPPVNDRLEMSMWPNSTLWEWRGSHLRTFGKSCLCF